MNCANFPGGPTGESRNLSWSTARGAAISFWQDVSRSTRCPATKVSAILEKLRARLRPPSTGLSGCARRFCSTCSSRGSTRSRPRAQARPTRGALQEVGGRGAFRLDVYLVREQSLAHADEREVDGNRSPRETTVAEHLW